MLPATKHRQLPRPSPVSNILLSCSLSWCAGAAVRGLNSAGWFYGPPIEDFVSMTSRAQSTAATYFTGVVKSDVVHLIVVCWALLLQSFGAQQLVHTRWPTEKNVHVCVEVKPISIPLCASTPATKHT